MPVRSVKRRYLWIHVESDEEFTESQIYHSIDAKIHFLYGVKGANELDYKLIEFYPDDQNLIARCNHNRLNEMRTVLAHLSEIDGSNTRFDVLRVGGTIRSLKKHVGIR